MATFDLALSAQTNIKADINKFVWISNCIQIERVKTTSRENESTRLLATMKNYSRYDDKANNIIRYHLLQDIKIYVNKDINKIYSNKNFLYVLLVWPPEMRP